MDLDDVSAVIRLCDANVHKLQTNLNAYQREVDAVYQVLNKSWANVGTMDRPLIALHDRLLSSLSEVNEYVIKLNLRVNLNKPGILINNNEAEPTSARRKESLENMMHTNDDGILVGDNELDMQQPCEMCSLKLEAPNRLTLETQYQQPKPPLAERTMTVMPSTWLIEPVLQYVQPRAATPVAPTKVASYNAQKESSQLALQPKPTSAERAMAAMPSTWLIEPVKEYVQPRAATLVTHTKVASPKAQKESSQLELPRAATPVEPTKVESCNAQKESSQLALPLQTPPQRKSPLQPPSGGQQMSGSEIYKMLLKNINAFAMGCTIKATVVHLNLKDNCFYVAEWGAKSLPLQKLLRPQVPPQELDQLPNFGEIFGVYDAQEQIIPRVVISAYTEGGGYDAYLVDYGEYIHLDGNEVIYALPDDVKTLPAEAIKCYVKNQSVTDMREYLYKKVQLRVLDNNGIDLVVDSVKEAEEEKEKTELEAQKLDETEKAGVQLNEADLALLNSIEEGTSDAVKAVMGYHPKDDQRICRHYDPKINGCFKGSRCRLVHQPLAPHGATKDVQLSAPILETQYLPPAPQISRGTERVLITFVSSPSEVYAQFCHKQPPLVFGKKEISLEQRQFKRMPHILDMVLARYNDGNFYRAQIVEEVDERGEFKVFYVDYGNTEFLPLTDLAQCNVAIALKPYRAVNCIIAGIERNATLSNQKTLECVEYLKSKILNEEIDVRLVRSMPNGSKVIKLLGRFAEVPTLLIQRRYVQPHCGQDKDSNASHSSDDASNDS